MAKGGGSTTTVEQQLAPEQREILDMISPIMQAYLTPRGQPVGGQSPSGGVAPGAAGGQQQMQPSGPLTGQQIDNRAAFEQLYGVLPGAPSASTGGGGQQAPSGPFSQGMMPEPFPGQRLAGFTPVEQQGQQMILDAAGGGAGDIVSNAAGAQNFLTSGAVLDPRTNPGLAGAVQSAIQPLEQQFTTSILPNIRDEAILAGGFGGSRQGVAEGLAAQGLQRESGAAAANIINPAYQAGLGAMTRGLALAPQTAASQFLPGEAVAGVGGQQRAMNQAQIETDLQRYLEEQFLPFEIAQQVAGMAFGLPIGGTQTTGQAPGVSPAQGALGGAATGAAVGSVFPGYGTAIGAGVGGLAGLLGIL